VYYEREGSGKTKKEDIMEIIMPKVGDFVNIEGVIGSLYRVVEVQPDKNMFMANVPDGISEEKYFCCRRITMVMTIRRVK